MKQIQGEEITEYQPYSLKVMGQIPEWLSGTLIRNGPVRIDLHGATQAHWFDGLAMLHGFSFHEGKVSYRNQFIRSQAYQKVKKKESFDYKSFAQDPCGSLFKRFFTQFCCHGHEGENANINVAKWAGDYVALTEIPLPIKFDLKTLKTLGVFSYQDHLRSQRTWISAHPHREPDSQSVINYFIEYSALSHYVIYSLAEGSRSRKIIAKIPVKEPSYMHSFSMTDNYVILVEYPFLVKPLDFLIKGKAFIKNFSWRPELKTKFQVIDKKSGSLISTYLTDPFFAFHHANAFEKDGALWVDIVTYADPSIIDSIANHDLKSNQAEMFIETKLERFCLKNGSVQRQCLLKGSLEFPRINEQRDGKPYHFLYLVDAKGYFDSSDERPIYKINVETQDILTWSQRGCYPGEPVFVKAPNGQKEDEGLILAVVDDLNKKSSFLLILDANNFQEKGRAYVNYQIPKDLHGQYFYE